MTLITLERVTLVDVSTPEGSVELATFVLDDSDDRQHQLHTPTGCILGQWPQPVGAMLTVEYRTNDENTDSRCGGRSVTVL